MRADTDSRDKIKDIDADKVLQAQITGTGVVTLVYLNV